MTVIASQKTKTSGVRTKKGALQLRVAEVTPVFPPYKGGIGMVCYQNTLTATERGYHVDVFTPFYASLRGKAARKKRVHTIGIFRMRPLLAWGNAACLPQLVWRLRRYDIVHFHYPFIGSSFFVLLAKIVFPRLKLIVTYHMDLVGRGRLRGHFFRLYNAFVPRLLFARADAVLFSSFDYAKHSSCRQLVEQHRERTHEIPHSVNTNYFHPNKKDVSLLEALRIAPDEKIVLFVGGLDDQHYFKGVDILLAAFESVIRKTAVRSRLIIVGEGGLRSQYEKRAREIGIASRVLFAGLVTNANLPLYYTIADMIVLPSIDSSEAFGVVLLEGMACAKPVIASDLPGPRSVVQHGYNGYLAHTGDAEDLAQKICLVLDDAQRAREMGARGRTLAEEYYSNHVVGQRLTEVYENLYTRKSL